MRESHADTDAQKARMDSRLRGNDGATDAQEARLDSRLRGNDGATQNLRPALDPGPRTAQRDGEGCA